MAPEYPTPANRRSLHGSTLSVVIIRAEPVVSRLPATGFAVLAEKLRYVIV
jgi:hypothetical protein